MARYFFPFETQEEAEEATRRECMAAYDRLPEAVRQAIRECSWDIHILVRIGKFTDQAPLIERIRSIRSERDALAFNAAYRR